MKFTIFVMICLLHRSKLQPMALSYFKMNQPNLVTLEEVESEMLKNFYKDSKKVDNKKMKSFF